MYTTLMLVLYKTKCVCKSFFSVEGKAIYKRLLNKFYSNIKPVGGLEYTNWFVSFLLTVS